MRVKNRITTQQLSVNKFGLYGVILDYKIFCLKPKKAFEMYF